jgi:hypothetical protein
MVEPDTTRGPDQGNVFIHLHSDDASAANKSSLHGYMLLKDPFKCAPQNAHHLSKHLLEG